MDHHQDAQARLTVLLAMEVAMEVTEVTAVMAAMVVMVVTDKAHKLFT